MQHRRTDDRTPASGPGSDQGETAQAVRPGGAAAPGDTHVAGSPPKPSNADAPDPLTDTSPDLTAPAAPAQGEVATQFPDPKAGGAPAASRPGEGSAPAATPGATSPGQAAPGHAVPGGAPGHAVPEQENRDEKAAHEKGIPGQAVPGQASAGAPPVPERFLETAEVERFKQRWHDVQAAFVDDPGESVRQAEELAAEVGEALNRALAAHRRKLSEPLGDGKGERPDTERLRLALRGYRDLLNRVFSA
ncbi:hypothetical protein [Actinomadura fibrosa]|uniref:Uncharacterized protein n=1 Tax=Actinomadura fibrosa TaxID=111802 RepID=A0ABW2XT30_9ACTN|nr:hypothetical protein [Actinomadura fibrosa]